MIIIIIIIIIIHAGDVPELQGKLSSSTLCPPLSSSFVNICFKKGNVVVCLFWSDGHLISPLLNDENVVKVSMKYFVGNDHIM